MQPRDPANRDKVLSTAAREPRCRNSLGDSKPPSGTLGYGAGGRQNIFGKMAHGGNSFVRSIFRYLANRKLDGRLKSVGAGEEFPPPTNAEIKPH